VVKVVYQLLIFLVIGGMAGWQYLAFRRAPAVNPEMSQQGPATPSPYVAAAPAVVRATAAVRWKNVRRVIIVKVSWVPTPWGSHRYGRARLEALPC